MYTDTTTATTTATHLALCQLQMHHDSLELVVQDFVVAVDPSHMTGRDAALRLECTDSAEDANILIHSGRRSP